MHKTPVAKCRHGNDRGNPTELGPQVQGNGRAVPRPLGIAPGVRPHTHAGWVASWSGPVARGTGVKAESMDLRSWDLFPLDRHLPPTRHTGGRPHWGGRERRGRSTPGRTRKEGVVIPGWTRKEGAPLRGGRERRVPRRLRTRGPVSNPETSYSFCPVREGRVFDRRVVLPDSGLSTGRSLHTTQGTLQRPGTLLPSTCRTLPTPRDKTLCFPISQTEPGGV